MSVAGSSGSAEGEAGSVRGLAEDVCRRVLEDPALEALWPEARGGLARLRRPLQIAVTGRVSAGKSTLVNALVGRRVAATGESETTSVNCAFRHAEPGSGERAEVRLAGAEAPVTVPVEEVATLTGLDTGVPVPVVVHLDHPLLASLTVIDSPGLSSPNEENSARAALVTGATRDAVGVADAALFVTSELPGRESEYAELDRFRRLFGDLRRAPTNTLFVFNQADRIEGVSAADPVRRLRARLDRPERRHELRRRVAAATAAVGLLAEAARTGFVDDRLVADLRRLGDHVADARDLADGPLLAGLEVPGVPAARRAELTARLGGFGIAAGVGLVRGGVVDAAGLAGELLALSGLDRLEQLVARTFADRSELLRAEATLGRLRTGATRLRTEQRLGAAARARVEDWVHQARLHPRAHGLRELNALLLSFEPRLGLDEDALAEVRDLLGGGTGRVEDGAPDGPEGLEDLDAAEVAELVAWARGRAGRWRDFALRLPETDRREVAEVMALSYERLPARLPPRPGGPG